MGASVDALDSRLCGDGRLDLARATIGGEGWRSMGRWAGHDDSSLESCLRDSRCYPSKAFHRGRLFNDQTDSAAGSVPSSSRWIIFGMELQDI